MLFLSAIRTVLLLHSLMFLDLVVDNVNLSSRSCRNAFFWHCTAAWDRRMAEFNARDSRSFLCLLVWINNCSEAFAQRMPKYTGLSTLYSNCPSFASLKQSPLQKAKLPLSANIRARSLGSSCRVSISLPKQGGLNIWRPQNFQIFWPPLPLSLSQISWFRSSICLLFGDPPSPIADVI